MIIIHVFKFLLISFPASILRLPYELDITHTLKIKKQQWFTLWLQENLGKNILKPHGKYIVKRFTELDI